MSLHESQGRIENLPTAKRTRDRQGSDFSAKAGIEKLQDCGVTALSRFFLAIPPSCEHTVSHRATNARSSGQSPIRPLLCSGPAASCGAWRGFNLSRGIEHGKAQGHEEHGPANRREPAQRKVTAGHEPAKASWVNPGGASALAGVFYGIHQLPSSIIRTGDERPVTKGHGGWSLRATSRRFFCLLCRLSAGKILA